MYLKGFQRVGRPELVGGSPIRSLGGWSEARNPGKGERIKGDERILGDSQFILGTLQFAEERRGRRYELITQGYYLDALGKRVGGFFDIDPLEICSRGKYKRLMKPRSVFCFWAVRESGETATSLSKRLGVTLPSISKSVLAGKKITKDMTEYVNENETPFFIN